ncbi:MAG: transcriptional regulator [Acidobacteria bacterium]|nr:transcriptional regulator [Acidobacteriota bacterium]
MKRGAAGQTPSTYTDQQLILAARLYYIDGMSQAEIGTFVRVSQSKVSRMLAIAQQRGLVRISVPEYESRNKALETSLRKRFDVEAIVVHSIPGVEVKPLRQILGYFAAPVVRQWFQPRSLIVLAGGRTVQPLVEQMQPVDGISGLRVAQGMGHIDATPGPFDAAELCRSFARAWNGSVLSLNAPLLFPDKESCQKFMRLPQIQDVLRTIARADVALVGIGTLEQSVLVDRAIYSKSELNELRHAEAAGEIFGRFYDHRGVECRTSLRDRTLSLELNQLRQITRRVGVVVGADRAPAVAAAIKGNLINTLVIDEAGATALLDTTQGKAAGTSSRSTQSKS